VGRGTLERRLKLKEALFLMNESRQIEKRKGKRKFAPSKAAHAREAC
jgi:hypothetical protein